jgi:hypothetical protein
VVNFFETFSTHYFISPNQDSMVKPQKREIKYQFMQFALEGAVLECSFPNHTQGNLRVNTLHVWW